MERIEYMVWRKKNNVKLIDVAKYIGCSLALISLFENDKANISDEKVSKYNGFIKNHNKKVGVGVEI